MCSLIGFFAVFVVEAALFLLVASVDEFVLLAVVDLMEH